MFDSVLLMGLPMLRDMHSFLMSCFEFSVKLMKYLYWTVNILDNYSFVKMLLQIFHLSGKKILRNKKKTFSPPERFYIMAGQKSKRPITGKIVMIYSMCNKSESTNLKVFLLQWNLEFNFFPRQFAISQKMP